MVYGMEEKISIKINGLVVGYGAEPVLSGVTAEIAGGEFVGIVGPNGSGKTTLLRSVARVLKPSGGAVLIDGKEVFSIPPRELAREMGVVPQDTVPAFEFSALEIVLMGRAPHLRRFQSEGGRDLEIAEEAMRRTGTLKFADRPFSALSGGERQRVVIARALAQEPKVILLDEPTSHLDINYQFEIMGLARRLNRDEGITVLAVLHDLNLAAQYSDRLFMLSKGKIRTAGVPSDVLTVENVKSVYGVDVWVRKHPTSGRPYVISGIDRTVTDDESSRFEHRPKVHVICGGGTGSPIFAKLLKRGYSVTAGVLNTGDTDQEVADALGIAYVSAPPFSPIPDDAAAENFRMAQAADVVIVSDMPCGAWNLTNLKTASAASDSGKKLVLFRPETFCNRNFAGAEAAEIVNRLVPLSSAASTLDELMKGVEAASIEN
ncbi:MAG: ABC transporter ATP-binding protein [Armatimonadota bacterium]